MLSEASITLRPTCPSPLSFPAWATAFFRAWTEQAVCVAESLWSHHPERVHGKAATAAFLLENRENRMKFGYQESPYSGMTRGIKVNLFLISLLMYLFPNKSGDMDLVIFMTPEVFFSEVINGKCPFILGFNFSFFK